MVQSCRVHPRFEESIAQRGHGSGREASGGLPRGPIDRAHRVAERLREGRASLGEEALDARARVGLAARLVNELRTRALSAGFEKLTAFTHDPRFFVRQGFSIVPHLWVPEKIATDCHGCALFRQCQQYAMLLPLHDVARFRPAVPERRRVAAIA